MRFDQLLRSRGIETSPDWPDQEHRPPSPNAIIVTFAPGDLGGLEHPEDLFVVEYLVHRPDAGQLQLSRRLASLRDQIQMNREWIAREEGSDDAPDSTGDGEDG
jgi:hypothetical protein